MLAALLPTAAYAAVGELVRNSAVENAALLEALEEAYGSDAETYYAILEEYGLLDEDGNLVTDEEIVVDGEAYTLDEIEDVLDDPNTELDQVAEVDGQHITLADLKTIIEIERYLAYVKATYFTEQELTQAQVNSFYDLADAWAGGEVRLLSANALTETGPAGVDHSVRLSVTAADTANENSTYTVTVKASASSAAPDQAITFSWRAVSGSVVATGGAQNVTLKPGESVKLQVNTGRVTGKLNGKATFLVQIYDVTNALFSDGSTRWEKSVSVSRSDTLKYQGTASANLTYSGQHMYILNDDLQEGYDKGLQDEIASPEDAIYSRASVTLSVPGLEAGTYNSSITINSGMFTRISPPATTLWAMTCSKR